MRIRELLDMMAVVELDADECRVLRQALNEVCNALDIEEFATRIGAERKDAILLLEQMKKLRWDNMA